MERLSHTSRAARGPDSLHNRFSASVRPSSNGFDILRFFKLPISFSVPSQFLALLVIFDVTMEDTMVSTEW